MRIALVKIANMGIPMAAGSFKASSSRTLFDVNSSWVKTLIQVGVKVADSPERPVLDAQLAITTLPAPERVQMVLPLRDGVLSGIAQGAMILALDTIVSTSAQVLAKQATRQGHAFIDAAGSGGAAGAAIWILTVMVGGSVSAFEAAKPVLSKMGKDCCSLRRIRTGKVAKISPIQSMKPPWPASQKRYPGVALGKDSQVKTGISARQQGDAGRSETYMGVIESALAPLQTLSRLGHGR